MPENHSKFILLFLWVMPPCYMIPSPQALAFAFWWAGVVLHGLLRTSHFTIPFFSNIICFFVWIVCFVAVFVCSLLFAVLGHEVHDVFLFWWSSLENQQNASKNFLLKKKTKPQEVKLSVSDKMITCLLDLNYRNTFLPYIAFKTVAHPLDCEGLSGTFSVLHVFCVQSVIETIFKITWEEKAWVQGLKEGFISFRIWYFTYSAFSEFRIVAN